MTIDIKKLEYVKDAPLWRRIFLYGDSWSGKTRLAGSAQDVTEMADVLIGDIDVGVRTLMARGDISSARVKNVQDVEDLLWMFVRGDKEVAQFRTLVLDGGSELAKLELAELAVKQAQAEPAKRDKDLNQMQDYLKLQNRLLRVLRMACSLPNINLIFTCRAQKVYPKLPGTQQANLQAEPNAIVPDLSEKIRKTVLGYFDDVWFIAHDEESGDRHLFTDNYGPVLARTRDEVIGKLLTTDGKPYIVNPTFSAIYGCYKKAYNDALKGK